MFFICLIKYYPNQTRQISAVTIIHQIIVCNIITKCELKYIVQFECDLVYGGVTALYSSATET